MLSFGLKGEDKACKFLQKKGLEIIKRNFHSLFGEIDIIASKDEILHFIEVKTSKNYDPFERITKSKYQKILKTIDYYLYLNPSLCDIQIDAILIQDDKIEWVQNISI